MSDSWFTKYELPTIRHLIRELDLKGEKLSTLVRYCHELSDAMDDPNYSAWDMLIAQSRRDRYINDLLSTIKRPEK